MQPRRILVTGAGGFVGRHLMTALAADMPESEARAAAADVTDATALAAEVAAFRPEACVHLAAVAFIPAAQVDPARAWAVNLHGTLNLARALIVQAPDCLLLFASSSDCYGLSFRTGRPLDEAAPLGPMNTYAATKAAADLALGALAREGLRVVRLRPFNHTGPGQSDTYVIPAFARQIARIEAGLQAPRLRVGALDSYRDFLDVRDVCDAYIACLRRGKTLESKAAAGGEILNIASGKPRRIGDALMQLLALSAVDAIPEIDASRLRPAEIPTASGDATLARQMLDWAPRIPWEQTLRDVLDDWRARVRT